MVEVFNIFNSFDFALIGKYLIAELLIGICIGVAIKYIAQFKANQADNTQIFSAKDYSSIYFGTNFPRGEFDPFKLPPEFVIVRYSNDRVICEEFFTFLGDSTKATYENGQCQGYEFSVASSPIYLCTVVIPIVLGFFPSILSFYETVGIPLLISGLFWMFVTFFIPILFILLKQERANPE
ncbi:MAG: hypothetical protein SWY16_23750 [Cyanobacteriota bacterium]|nr:hypothetical protein [Cyanobacteriota bacterium]